MKDISTFLQDGEGGQGSPMAMEVSSLNTAWLVQSLRVHHPNVDIQSVLSDTAGEEPFFITNLKTGKIEPVTVFHLERADYWFSNRFMVSFYRAIEKHLPDDPDFACTCGRSFYKTKAFLKTAIGLPLIGPYRLVEQIVAENNKFNQTKTAEIVACEKGRVVLRLTHKPNVIWTDFAWKWHRGAFESYGRMAGMVNMHINTSCIERGPEKYGDPGRAIYEFEMLFEEVGVLQRLWNRLLYAIPSVKTIIDNSAQIQADHNQQILNRDRLIEQRTNHLLHIQKNLMAAERLAIENRLQALSKKLITTEERERRAIAEDLHDSTTQLLALSVKGLRRYLKGDGNLGELENVYGYVEEALASTRSLSYQISPPVLYDFGLESALEWLAKEVGERHPVDIECINLLEHKLALQDQEKIILYRMVREAVINALKHAGASSVTIVLLHEDGRVKLEVEDNGVGFDPAALKKGFGISTAADRLAAIGAGLDIVSSSGNGTRIVIVLDGRETCISH